MTRTYLEIALDRVKEAIDENRTGRPGGVITEKEADALQALTVAHRAQQLANTVERVTTTPGYVAGRATAFAAWAAESF
jgi:hypothetical protein